MRLLAILFVFFYSSARAQSDSTSANIFLGFQLLPSSQEISTSAQNSLTSIIKSSLNSNSSIRQSQYSPFLLSVTTDLIDKKILPGAPSKIVSNISFYLSYSLLLNSTVISDLRLEINGIGTSDYAAEMDAISKITESDEYKKYLKHLHEVASGNYNEMVDAQDLINKGREEGKDEKVFEAVIEMNKDGVPTSTIAKYLKISEEQVVQIIENQANK
jgi:hypothetical protein